MIERYYEVSCDVCGDPEWIEPFETLAEFFASDRTPRWRRKKDLTICYGCWDSGSRWADATCHQPARDTEAP